MALALGTNVGFVTSAPSVDPNGTAVTSDGSSFVVKHISPAINTLITEIGWYKASGATSSNFQVGLYADSAGVAGTRLFVSSDAASGTTAGWKKISGLNWAITPNTNYWIGMQHDAHSGSSQIDLASSGGSGIDTRTSQTVLTNPYGGGAVSDADGMYAIYALVATGPSFSPSISESVSPSISESLSPSLSPSLSESLSPSQSLSASPSLSLSLSPSASSSVSPSLPNESPTVILNTPYDLAELVPLTPTFNFTGTDENSDLIEYEIQIDTVDTFDSAYLLDKFSNIEDLGFDAGHPFGSGVPVNYTVQHADRLLETTTYYWRVRARDPLGSNVYGEWSDTFSFLSDAPLEINSVNELIGSANLKAYYRFESGALTTDSSGEGHTLTAISDPAEDASGQFGGAVALDGNDAYSATDHADFDPAGDFTIGCWVKTSNTGVVEYYTTKLMAGDSTKMQYYLAKIGTDKARFVVFNTAGGAFLSAISTVTIADGAWHFIVGVHNHSTPSNKIYVDGGDEVTGTTTTGTEQTTSTADFVIGGTDYTSGYTNFFTGSIDDAFLFNGTALSADQITSIYDGTINSASPSASPSISSSRSPSISSSFSLSLSPSLSPSVSLSRSPSLSPSASPSVSPSISPSPSTGWENYTRGDEVSLPSNDTNLETLYSAQDYLDVDTKNDVQVGQTATSQYAIHQFKDFAALNSGLLEWEGQTNMPPSLSTVYLQIYNRNSSLWETVDSDNSSPINTDFTLTAYVVDFTNYKDGSGVVSCRVYQLDL